MVSAFLRLSLAIFLAGAMGACATARLNQASWDTDADGTMDRSEFDTCMAVTGLFRKWDRTRDGHLDQREFEAGLNGFGVDLRPAHGFTEWDRNGDGGLDESEFAAGCFREIDVNENGLVDDFEFRMIGYAMGLRGSISDPRP